MSRTDWDLAQTLNLIAVNRTLAPEVLRAMVTMLATGDLSALEATVDPDYLDHQGLDGEPIHGPGGFASVVSAARSSFEALNVTIEDLITEPGRAAARLHWRGTRASGELVVGKRSRSSASQTAEQLNIGAVVRDECRPGPLL